MAVAKKTARIRPAQVKTVLSSYAERGVFRSFSQVASENGKAEFHFHWLWNLPFHVAFDPANATLSFRKLLPGIKRGSQLESELKEFIDGFSDGTRVEHRGVDRSRVAIRYANQRGTVSLSFRMAGNDCEYGVRKAVNVVNEIFLEFLNARYPEYMAAKFKLPEE